MLLQGGALPLCQERYQIDKNIVFGPELGLNTRLEENSMRGVERWAGRTGFTSAAHTRSPKVAVILSVMRRAGCSTFAKYLGAIPPGLTEVSRN